MPKFVIEREIEGIGAASAEELKSISERSCAVLRTLGPEVQWVESYVTADKIYCVYHATDEKLIHTHAQMGGFPADRVSAVATVISPVTAE
jgi:hypothetical protein